jgi:hypothetical protein
MKRETMKVSYNEMSFIVMELILTILTYTPSVPKISALLDFVGETRDTREIT